MTPKRPMLNPQFVIRTISLIFVVCSTGVACAQKFPDKPIRIVTGGAGGGNDVLSRLIARGLTENLGQQVVVDNRPSGVIPGEIVAKAPPDGYTLAISGSSFWISPLFIDKPPYDPIRDFSPVMLPVTTPNILAVTSSLPVQSVKDLIALAKAKPGELNYGTPGSGSSPHLGGELFKLLAGVKIVRVNYKSAPAALNDLIAGQVQLSFGNAASVAPHAKTGRLKLLAVTSAQVSPLFPDLPTVAATGLPGYELISPFGIFAPAKTPAVIVSRLNEEILRVLRRMEAKDVLVSAGIEVVGSSPEHLSQVVKSEVAKWSKVIREAGIRGD